MVVSEIVGGSTRKAWSQVGSGGKREETFKNNAQLRIALLRSSLFFEWETLDFFINLVSRKEIKFYFYSIELYIV